MRSFRSFLHAARIADAILFWPVFLLVVWGELTDEIDLDLFDFLPHNDKILHFLSYFVLGVMAALAFKPRWAMILSVVALICVGGALEIIQGYVGRSTDIYDAFANAAGALAGAAFARSVAAYLRHRFAH